MLLAIVSLIGFFVFLIALLWLYQTHSRFFKLIHQIPGPAEHPILGNFITNYAVPSEKIFSGDRERSLKFYPIYKQWILHVGAVSLLDPQDLEIVMSNPKHHKKSQIYDLLHPWLGTGLLTSHGDKWKVRRKMLTPAFHFSILQNFVTIFNEETARFVRTLSPHVDASPVDIAPYVTELTLKSIAETSTGTCLDFDNEVNRRYKNALLDFSEVVVYRMVRPWLYNSKVFRLLPLSFKSDQYVKILHNFTKNVIAERRKILSTSDFSYSTGKRLAMLDLLLRFKEEGADIDDDGIREEMDTFMFEGHDTTAVAVCFILLTLAKYPEVQQEVRQEILDVLGDTQVPTYNDLQQLSYTERCIKECLRLYPSVPFVARDAYEDFVTRSGHIVPKGAMIHIHIFDIHRNPNIYPNPLKFDPDRFLPENIQKRHPFAYIPFSAGPRNCIGQKFAMLELKAVLCGVLREYMLESVEDPEDYVFVTDLVLRTKDKIMKLKLKSRK